MLSVAFVNFFKEARGRRVVKVEDIEDFQPKTHGDFDERRICFVKWPHLPNEGSFSTESLYEAKILCLGNSMEDLEHEARAIGLKLPKVYPVTQDAKSPDLKKSKRGRKIREAKPQVAAASSGPDPHGKKKKKTTPEDRARESRHLKVLDNYDTLFIPDAPVRSDQGNLHSQTKHSLTDSNSPSKKQAIRLLKSTSSIKKPTTILSGKKLNEDSPYPKKLNEDSPYPMKLNQDSPSPKNPNGDSPSPKQLRVCSGKSMNRSSSVSPAKELVGNTQTVKQLGSASHSDLQCFSKSMNENSSRFSKSFDSLVTSRKMLPDAASSLKKISESDPNGDEVLSFPESDLTGVELFSTDTSVPFAQPPTPSKVKFNPPSAKENQCSDFKGRFSLRNQPSKAKLYDSDDSNTTATSYIASNAEKELYCRKIQSLEASTKRLQHENKKLYEESTNYKEEINKMNEKLAKYTEVNMKLTEKLLQQRSVSSNEVSEIQGMEAASGTPVKTASTPGAAFQSSPSYSSPEKGQSKRKLSFDETDSGASNSSRSKKRKLVDPREENVTSSSECAEMIIDALKGKTQLQTDGTGKVHIGNGLWIAQDLWEDKLRKPTVSPNIALRDAMEKCYSKAGDG